MAEKSILDPVSIAKISNLYLKAKYVVEGFFTGLHKSSHKGFSQEFAHHRQYSPGDDLRYIDWKVFAKTDRFFVKQFSEESNLRAYVVLDNSSSMGFAGSNGVSKFEYASVLAASLCYIIIGQGDSAGLAVFNSELKNCLPPNSERAYFGAITDAIQNLKVESRSEFSVPLLKLGGMLHKRNLIILISDLLGDPEKILDSIRYFKHKKNEVIVFHVLAREEMELEYKGSIRFKDLETAETAATYPEMIKREYKKLFDSYLEVLKHGFRGSDIEYSLATTDTRFDLILGNYLTRRG